MAQVLAIIQMVDAFAGSKAAQILIGFFKGPDSALTAEQKANLDAHYADYVARIAKLKLEVGEG